MVLGTLAWVKCGLAFETLTAQLALVKLLHLAAESLQLGDLTTGGLGGIDLHDLVPQGNRPEVDVAPEELQGVGLALFQTLQCCLQLCPFWYVELDCSYKVIIIVNNYFIKTNVVGWGPKTPAVLTDLLVEHRLATAVAGAAVAAGHVVVAAGVVVLRVGEAELAGALGLQSDRRLLGLDGDDVAVGELEDAGGVVVAVAVVDESDAARELDAEDLHVC